MAKTSKVKISAAERRSEALKLRKDGESLRSIAQTLEVSVSTIHDDIQKALAQLREQQSFSTEQWVTLELERLDMATQAITQQA
jgi:DNA-binding NarL/FixJ family response regulator